MLIDEDDYLRGSGDMPTEDPNADDLEMDMEENRKDEEEETEGTSASVHVPFEIATHMKVDSPKEMMALTITKVVKRKLPIANKIQTMNIKKIYKGITVLDEPTTITTIKNDRAAAQTTTNTTGRKAQ